MTLTKINLNRLIDKEKGYLFGLFIGDGYLYHDQWRHYKVNYFLNPKTDKDIVKYTTILLKKIGLLPYIMTHHGCLIIRLNSKEFYTYLIDKSQNIFLEENEEFIVGFISGFIDSDGYVAKGDIVISNKNKKLLEITQLWCEKLSVNTKLWRQNNDINCKKFKIWRLRVGTRFKYEKHHSRKILRVYGGGKFTDCPP